VNLTGFWLSRIQLLSHQFDKNIWFMIFNTQVAPILMIGRTYCNIDVF